VYIDTNIFVYVALKHPDFYDSCLEVLEMLVEGHFKGCGSNFVVFELFGSLARLNPLAAYEAVKAYLQLPITLLELDDRALEYARDIAERVRVTYDAIHAGLMARHGIEVVVTEDLRDWLKIARAWQQLEKRHGWRPLTVYSPTRGPIVVDDNKVDKY